MEEVARDSRTFGMGGCRWVDGVGWNGGMRLLGHGDMYGETKESRAKLVVTEPKLQNISKADGPLARLGYREV